jgi:hypothetical protein
MIMGAEEGENQPFSPTGELASEVTQEEPIEQVMSQDTTDSGAVGSSESTIESEDQERFEETAKFEEEVEPKPPDVKRKTRTKPDSKLITSLHDKLR